MTVVPAASPEPPTSAATVTVAVNTPGIGHFCSTEATHRTRCQLKQGGTASGLLVTPRAQFTGQTEPLCTAIAIDLETVAARTVPVIVHAAIMDPLDESLTRAWNLVWLEWRRCVSEHSTNLGQF